MTLLRRLLLLVVCLVPLVTLAHRDDLGRWETQRSAMAGPDEFSYLLMADHFMRGGGLSLKESLGRDTFYPPGFPLLLAACGKVFGLTAFTAHAFNAVMLCLDTLVAYLFSRRILGALASSPEPFEHRRFRIDGEACAWLALVVAGIFATNWHVLETSLLIMSEPSFMLAVFGWLAVALKWPEWVRAPGLAALVGTLAIVAWSIRGAGIVCVAATGLFPLLLLVRRLVLNWRQGRWDSAELLRKVAVLAVVVVLAVAYQATIHALSPEKSIASGQASANSYPRQLMHGLTDGGRLSATTVRGVAEMSWNLLKLFGRHFGDYASSFVPWYRDDPDFHFREIAGKIFGILGLTGWLWHATRIRRAPGMAGLRFLDLFVLLYFGLYLVWPFDFARFWSPLLPVMLVFAADGVVRFTESRRIPGSARAAVPLVLLLALSAVEVWHQLGGYARRLNYVSEALATTVETIMRRSPDPDRALVCVLGGDEHFALAWYFSQARAGAGRRYLIRSPEPHVAAKGGNGETPAELLVRSVTDMQSGGGGTVYLVSYFTHTDGAWVLGRFHDAWEKAGGGKGLTPAVVYQKEIIAKAWALAAEPSPAPATGEAAD